MRSARSCMRLETSPPSQPCHQQVSSHLTCSCTPERELRKTGHKRISVCPFLPTMLACGPFSYSSGKSSDGHRVIIDVCEGNRRLCSCRRPGRHAGPTAYAGQPPDPRIMELPGKERIWLSADWCGLVLREGMALIGTLLARGRQDPRGISRSPVWGEHALMSGSTFVTQGDIETKMTFCSGSWELSKLPSPEQEGHRCQSRMPARSRLWLQPAHQRRREPQHQQRRRPVHLTHRPGRHRPGAPPSARLQGPVALRHRARDIRRPDGPPHAHPPGPPGPPQHPPPPDHLTRTPVFPRSTPVQRRDSPETSRRSLPSEPVHLATAGRVIPP